MNPTPSTQEAYRLCTQSLERSRQRRKQSTLFRTINRELAWIFGTLFVLLAIACAYSLATGTLVH